MDVEFDEPLASPPPLPSPTVDSLSDPATPQHPPQPRHGLGGRPALKTLDLRGLRAGDDGDRVLSETQQRRQKQQFYEKQCSKIDEGLYLSGDWVARSRETLQEHKITHVLNCVGFICKEHFKEQLQYKTYYLHDSPNEDILTVLYDALEFIDDAVKAGGRILVHCSQGISRSATLVIAYLMWRSGSSYDEVFARVKEARAVANPNLGFTCQLLQWQKRRQMVSPARIRLYRMSPHCGQAPFMLVPRIVPAPKNPNHTPMYPCNTYRELDRRGAFVVHTPTRIFVWIGAACPPAFAAAARYHAELLRKYEHAHPQHRPSIVDVRQSAEPPELLALLDPPLLDPEAAKLHARRASLADELATGSTPCFPAQDEVLDGQSLGLLGWAASEPLSGAGQATAPGLLSGLGLGFSSDPAPIDTPTGFSSGQASGFNALPGDRGAPSPCGTGAAGGTYGAAAADAAVGASPGAAASSFASFHAGSFSSCGSASFHGDTGPSSAAACAAWAARASLPSGHSSSCLPAVHNNSGGMSGSGAGGGQPVTALRSTSLNRVAGAWTIGEVDAYTRDYQLYGDAVRAARAAAGSGGSGTATGLDGTDPHGAAAPAVGTPMVWGLARSATLTLDTPRGGATPPGAPGSRKVGSAISHGGSGLRSHHRHAPWDDDEDEDGGYEGAHGHADAGDQAMEGVEGSGAGAAGGHEGPFGDVRKKYRRSESGTVAGVGIAGISRLGQSGRAGAPPLPCLHTSMGDDEMDGWGS